MASSGATSSSIPAIVAPQHYCDRYRNKLIVAPMVRVCTLPFRLLALDYGADLVYSEETIDWKILRSQKRYNAALGTTDFIDYSDGTVFLRTCERERGKLIVQLGTSDATRALKVARMVEPYVAGIDVNMGCPKEFSIKGGMGAALLTQPDKIQKILTTLVNGLNVPVTCKIRILPELSDTLELCRLIERCGVAALAVHARRKEERPQHPNQESVIAEIAKVLKIPVISNGGSKEITKYTDIESFCDRTGTSSTMLARVVMWNCSILRPEGILPLDDVIKSYLRYCIQYDNPFTFTKYTVQNMLRGLQESPRGKAFLETQTFMEIAQLWNLSQEYSEALKIQQKLQEPGEIADQRRWVYQSRDEVTIVKHTNEVTGDVKEIKMPMQFIRGNYLDADLPKMILNRHVTKNNLNDPVLGVHSKDRYFIGYMDFENIRYQTTCIEKSRRYAEQAAVLVYLHATELVDRLYGFVACAGSRKYQHLADLVAKTPRLERQQQQANKAHLGRNRRRQENTGHRKAEKAARQLQNYNTKTKVSKDVLVDSGSNTEQNIISVDDTEQNIISVANTEQSCGGSCAASEGDNKRDYSECSPTTHTDGESKVFIRSVDDENLLTNTRAINLNSRANMLRIVEKSVDR